MADLWRDILEAARADKAVNVLLSPGQRIRRTKKRVGRPRLIYIGWSHYAGWDPAKGTRPVCARRGCRRRLKRDQPFACSRECAERAMAEAADVLVRGQAALAAFHGANEPENRT